MKAVIYSKPNCPFCVKAKNLLNKQGAEIEEKSAVDERDTLIEMVTEITGDAPRTVPQIWVDDKYIGGFTELDAYIKAL